MENDSSPSSSTPAPAAFQAMSEQEVETVPSPIMDSNLRRCEQSTIMAGDSTEDLSLTTCKGSIVEAETVLQIPDESIAKSSIAASPGIA